MRVQLPAGVGRSIDAIIAAAFRAFGCTPMGGASESGWSKQSDFQRCMRRYQLKHELGAAPLLAGAVSPGLDIGSVGHALLAVHYAALLPDDRYPGYQPNLPSPMDLLQAMTDAGLPQEIAMVVEQCYLGYVEFWAQEDVRSMAVEMPAGDAAFHTARFDHVFYTEDAWRSGLWVQEHKFLKAGTDLDEYRMHGEILGEVLAFHLDRLDEFFSMPLNGVCLNVIFKPTAKTLPRYQRIWISPSEEVMRRYVSDREYWIGALENCRRFQVWPRALEGCKRYRLCRFFSHCRDLDDGQLTFAKE